MQFTVEPLRDPAMLGRQWRELEARADPHFFLSWSWMSCWVEQFGPPVQALTGWAEGRIVLLGLLVPHRRRVMPGFAVSGLRLHTTGDQQRDVIAIEYNGFLVDRAFAGRAEGAAIDFLMRTPGCDEVHLQYVRPEYEALSGQDRFLWTRPARHPSWRVDLDAVRSAGGCYLDGLGSGTRQQIRRAMRLYEQRGPLRLTRARDVAEGLRFLDALGALNRTRWRKRGKPGAFDFPHLIGFNRRLVAACLPRGEVELAQVSCGGTPIGYLYNFIQNGQVYFYLSGFLYPEDQRLKPGLVTHALCIQRHVEEGARIYDFMAGEARYKANLGQPGPDFFYVLVQRRTAAVRLEQSLQGVKRIAHAALERLAPAGAGAAEPELPPIWGWSTRRTWTRNYTKP